MKPNYYSVIPASVRYDNDLTDSEKLLYSEIVALSNQNGECWAGNTYFANLYDVTTVTISRRISKLRKKGYIQVEIIYKDKTKQIDKRVIKISNHIVKNNAGGINANVNTYQQDKQEGINRIVNRGINTNVKGNTTSNEYYKINNKTYSPLEAFKLFYENYPKKVQRGRAERAFRSKVKKSQTLELILKDLERRKDFYDWKKDNGKYIPHPATYLNGEQWLDEYEVGKKETFKNKGYIKQQVDIPEYNKNTEIEEDVDELKAELYAMLGKDKE